MSSKTKKALLLYIDIRICIYIMNQTEFFKCLSDTTRLNILLLIVQQGERCVCDLTTTLDLSQPKISRHLALLRSTQILQDRRQGQWIYYRLHDALPAWCIEILQIISAQNLRFNDGLLTSSDMNNYCE